MIMTIADRRHASNLSFRIMASYLKFRERFRKPRDFMEYVGVRPGDMILDHGCGIGSYSIPAAEMTGPEGTVYALDIHPIAVERTKERAMKAGLDNIETIHSGLENGLPGQYIDTILLIDVYTWIPDMLALLTEFYRVLKPNGRLVILIDHASPDGCIDDVASSGLFELDEQDENVIFYSKK